MSAHALVPEIVDEPDTFASKVAELRRIFRTVEVAVFAPVASVAERCAGEMGDLFVGFEGELA